MYKKLLLFILFLGIIIIPKNTFALQTETPNGDIISVSDFTSFRDFVFTEFVIDYDNNCESFKFDNLSCFDNTNTYYCIMYPNTTRVSYYPTQWSPNDYWIGTNGTARMFQYSKTNGQTSELDFTNQPNALIVGSNYLSNTDLYKEQFDIVSSIENYSFKDLTDIYCSNIKPEEPTPPTTTDFPITKEEFYTLLMLLGFLINLLFLRWCFPMKGGKKL